MSKDLRKVIDRMVEDSIRRILPQVMNEVLLKTIANSNVIQESTPQVARRAPAPVQQKASKAPSRKPSSLSQLLDESAGADFYQDPRAAMTEATREEQAPTNTPMAQRIQSLPPELQSLAEGMVLDDDGGEMWEDGDSITPVEAGPDLGRAAKVAGLDFSRMQKAIQVTEKKKGPDQSDRAAQAQFEEMRIKRMRERLNDGKPVE